MNSGTLQQQFSQRITLWLVQFVLALVIIFASSLAFCKPLIFMPMEVDSDWYVVQGQNGSYSHYGNQTYGYDFLSASGTTFGKKLYSPGNGRVVEIRAGVQDWSNNSSSNYANNSGWGNTVVIEMVTETGALTYVRIAHMQYGTMNHLCTKEQSASCNDTIKQGDYIGKIGQTGYSSNPHLHIQMMTSVRGSSVDFDFVEGHPRQGDIITSRLKPDLWVVDNYGRINAGAPLTATRAYLYKTWRYYSPLYASVGTYAVSTDRYATYKWNFRLSAGGRYDIYASCPTSGTRTLRAQYTFSGNGMMESSFVNQRYHGASGNVGLDDLHYVDTVFPSAAASYSVKVRNTQATGNLCADAIFLHKRNW